MMDPPSGTQQQVGVADYYAILGVGDRLVWKHQQKQNEEFFGGGILAAESSSDEPEEEERFVREIVQVAIVTVDASTATAETDGSASRSGEDASSSSNNHLQQQQQQQIYDHRSILNVSSYRSESSVAQSQQQDPYSFLSVPPSPSNTSEATSAQNLFTTAPRNGNNLHQGWQQTSENGWTLIRTTLPSAAPGFGLTLNDQSWGAGSDQPAASSSTVNVQLWNKFSVWDANLDIATGLRAHIQSLQLQGEHAMAQAANRSGSNNNTNNNNKGLRAKVESKIKIHAAKLPLLNRQQQQHQQHLPTSKATSAAAMVMNPPTNFYLAFQRRETVESDTPGISDVQLLYVRLHREVLPRQQQRQNVNNQSDSQNTFSSTTPALSSIAGQLWKGSYQSSQQQPNNNNALIQRASTEDSDRESVGHLLVRLQDYLHLPPEPFDEWSIPEAYRLIRDPTTVSLAPRGPRTTVMFDDIADEQGMGGAGVEAVETLSDDSHTRRQAAIDPELLLPKIAVPGKDWAMKDEDDFCYIPVLALRRQLLGDEQRYHEDAALTDIAVTFQDRDGNAVGPCLDDEDDDEEQGTFTLLGQTPWSVSPQRHDSIGNNAKAIRGGFGKPRLLLRRNLPFGFADAAFATRVWGRFPGRNYNGLPLPEEELPMFCYPTGCRLHRAQYSDAPLPQYYGFVVKNERGDSIYVSCVSFMEPLAAEKARQLNEMSERRRRTSLPHRRFCEKQERRRLEASAYTSLDKHYKSDSADSEATTEADSNFILTAFDDETTFENKTICLVGRYPFWTAFRKFLSHLHVLSGSSSELPLERWISHLLLSVPLPRPGGSNVIVPLPALNEPMVLSIPPEKDFPLLDLPYQRLFACLEIKTVVIIVLGFLALERKVIVMSTRPSLVLDVCELLRSLLFPFELCAPYVPRLTEPFKSSLNFPGALFVGIHDDGEPYGLATMVKETFPEDSIVVDLDTGAVDCDGDRYEVLSSAWDIIPEDSRNALVSELEALCRDAKIVDGQEPLDSLYDSAFFVDLPAAVEVYDANAQSKEPLDDRAVRDAFLRFFCSVLGGYERFLVVPDADFLVSGDEWFDAKAFLSAASKGKRAYLSSLVSTQLFQSFIQRRTEASDVHCMLFDECVVEYHSSAVPYGRLGGDVEAVPAEDGGSSQMLYSLLVDQSCAMPSNFDQGSIAPNRSIDASEADSNFSLNLSRASASVADSSFRYSESVVNVDGDLVSAPSRQDLLPDGVYIYCKDGNPCFPYHLRDELLLPNEPLSWEIEMTKTPDPLLARSEREMEEANRRRKMATSNQGLQNQRRCMWQLPKLMGSHFLGSWLLCIPALVSNSNHSREQQSCYLLRALGALRLLRSKQRIVPDEAAYRALMVACGRSWSDRRVELVKLFGLLRSDGIFPSAVTLGQYTKALAEGYSKRSTGTVQEDDYHGVEVTESGSKVGRYSLSGTSQRKSGEFQAALEGLDPSLEDLELQGKRWRHKQNGEKEATQTRKKRNMSKPWLPVVYSTSFAMTSPQSDNTEEKSDDVRLLAIWSRTRGCSKCGYVPLEEEIQAGWDVIGGEHEIPGSVACSRCDSLVVPMLAYKEMSVEEARTLETGYSSAGLYEATDPIADFGVLPPQIVPLIKAPVTDDGVRFVTYISPWSLRKAMEQYVEEFGEEVLQRDRLKELDPEVFYNLWWYCARFSLPFPLPTGAGSGHVITFAAWDRTASERGCYCGAKVLNPLLQNMKGYPTDDDQVLSSEDPVYSEYFDDYPLLSRFNLQGFFPTVWDHPDLSKLLVTLVEACDKRDFKTVVECALENNLRRKSEFDHLADLNSDLDIYRTILFLAKYQCTTAFHTFFPATAKPCKGYHFWCAIGTPLPIFDRLIRDAVRRLNSSKDQSSIIRVSDVSDVALGFRCVFGHLI